MEQLIKYFKDKHIQSLLDVGTGSGDFIKVLKEIFPNTSMFGVDPNTDSLAEAAQKYPDVEFMEMGGEKLNFEENYFDCATISMALHHLPEINKTLFEMQRVVKPGGWIIVSELYSDNLNEAQEVHKMYHHFRSETDRILGISHNSTFKKNQIIEMIEKSGINIQFHFDFGYEPDLIENPVDIEERVEKMKTMLERIKDYPEYELLQPQIAKFREKALRFGFQPATRVVVVGRV